MEHHPDSILDPPKRPTIEQGAEWEITARLVRGNTVLEESSAPLRIVDSWFNDRFHSKGEFKGERNGRFREAGTNIARWLDDLGQRRSRNEAAQKHSAKKGKK